MKKMIIFLFVTIFIFSENNIIAFGKADLEKFENGESDLSGADLSGADLSGADLSSTCLWHASLWHTNLWHTHLWHANLENADLSNADLYGADLRETIVKNANFKNVKGLTNIQKKYLREHEALNVPPDVDENAQYEWKPGYLIILFQKVFNITKNQSLKLYHWLKRKDFSGKNLENQNLTKHYLVGAILNQANLKNADLNNQNLKNIKLDDAIVVGANFAHVKNLTNNQKQYLREHGAINVPIEIIYELVN